MKEGAHGIEPSWNDRFLSVYFEAPQGKPGAILLEISAPERSYEGEECIEMPQRIEARNLSIGATKEKDRPNSKRLEQSER